MDDVERVARALFIQEGVETGYPRFSRYWTDSIGENGRERFRERARAAIAASGKDAAGYFGTSIQTLENTYLHHHPDFQAGTAAIMDRKG